MLEFTKSQVLQAAVEILEQNGEAEYRDDYSGRGMYGSTTEAIVYEGSLKDVNGAIAKALTFLIEEDCPDHDISLSEMMELAMEYQLSRSDNMGKYSYIYY